MKKIIAAVALVGALTLPMASYAEKIGFVNVNLLFNEYDKIEGVQKKIEKKFGAKKKTLEKQGEKINAEGKKLKTNELMMTESKLKDATKKLNDMLIKMRDDEIAFKKELQQAQSAEMGKFRNSVSEIIKAYAEDKAYDLILNEGVVFVAPRADVTNDILQIMRKPKSEKKVTKK
ncbi:hypothetical protein MNBD_GAMMA10-3303 [hydrothermal vent metagenome]|uniref:Outer membrane protein H n=1 Tax=hydrothermal vent metagenome TaxID=652676 RepID=A0A3B0XTF2_9ZZZZ